MRPTTPLACRRVPTETDAAPTHTTAVALTLALALLALVWPTAVTAKVEWIGNLNGKPVYLIWGGECSALDPPNDNVATLTITYTGPPQPGVFTDVELFPPFDTYSTDGATYLTIAATGAPMPLPCPTCFEHAFTHATSVPLDPTAGAEAPFQFVEYNANGGFCAGTVTAAQAAGIPAMNAWATLALVGTLLALGAAWALRASPGEVRA